MPFTSYFASDFTGATDPSLAPIPFTSVTVTGANTLAYTSSGGVSGGPGASVLFAGTTGVAYGQGLLSQTITPGAGLLRATFSVNFSVLPFAGLSGNSMVMARAENGTNQVLLIQLFKSGTSTAVFRAVDVEHAITVTGSTNISASTYYNVRADMMTNGGAESLTLYVDGVQEAKATSLGALTRTVDRVSFCSVSTSTVPAAGAAFVMDNVSLSYGMLPGPPGRPLGASSVSNAARFPGTFF